MSKKAQFYAKVFLLKYDIQTTCHSVCYVRTAAVCSVSKNKELRSLFSPDCRLVFVIKRGKAAETRLQQQRGGGQGHSGGLQQKTNIMVNKR